MAATIMVVGVLGYFLSRAHRGSSRPEVVAETQAESTPRPAVISQRVDSRPRGAANIPNFEGFYPPSLGDLPTDPATGNRLVGSVNGTTLSLDQLTAKVRRLRVVARPNLPNTAMGRNERIEVLPGVVAPSAAEAHMIAGLIHPAFDSLVDEVLVEAMATSYGLSRSRVDMRGRLRDANQFRRAGQSLQDELMVAGRTMEDLEGDLELRDLDRRILHHISMKEVKPATPAQLASFLSRPDVRTSASRLVVRARHVAIPLEADANERRVEAAQRIAEQALSALIEGTSWSVVVGRYSYDQLTRGRDGDLGFFDPEDMDAEFAAVVKTMPVGGMPQIVRSGQGIHVVQVTDRQEGDGQLVWRMMEAQWIFREKRQELRRQARVENFLK
jgi:hypothetical protein